jgi:hypothetical protein
MSRFFTLAQARTYIETADAGFDLVVGVAWFSIFEVVTTAPSSRRPRG